MVTDNTTEDYTDDGKTFKAFTEHYNFLERTPTSALVYTLSEYKVTFFKDDANAVAASKADVCLFCFTWPVNHATHDRYFQRCFHFLDMGFYLFRQAE